MRSPDLPGIEFMTVDYSISPGYVKCKVLNCNEVCKREELDENGEWEHKCPSSESLMEYMREVKERHKNRKKGISNG